MDQNTSRTKVIGIGLNKTGTKTMGHYLIRWGYRHRSYDSGSTNESPSFDLYKSGDTDALLDIVRNHDSCEDWPWPLLYRQIDEAFDDVKFVLTVRKSADTWYRSLCNMAVRLGPMPLFEKTVYGSAMPQGRRRQHVEIYNAHNAAVREHFADRPDKLLVLCWEDGDDAATLAQFLGLDDVDTSPLHSNKSPGGVYSGDNLLLAHAHRLAYRLWRSPQAPLRRIAAAARRRIPGA